AMVAITAAMMMITNIAATRPKPFCFDSGRIVDVHLLQQGNDFIVLAQGQAQGDQATTRAGTWIVGERATTGGNAIHHQGLDGAGTIEVCRYRAPQSSIGVTTET